MKYRKSIIYGILAAIFMLVAILLVVSLIYYSYQNGGETISLAKGPIKYILVGFSVLTVILIIIFLIVRLTPAKVLSGSALDVKIDFDEYDKGIHSEIIDKNEAKRAKNGPDNNEPIEVLEIDNKRHTAKTRIINKKALNKNGNEEINTTDVRFFMLKRIDEAYENYKAPQYNNEITLKEICEDFRNFASYKLKLYYDILDIRRFIAGLAVTKLIILQGMSGTGKTSLPYAFGEYLKNKTIIVPIQPMWKERTDLIGYYNEFTRKFNETTLLNTMYEANYNKNIYVTVLDEMNIARIEYYFAEFLSLLEIPNPDGRELDVVNDVWEKDPKLLRNGKMKLPINMWFIGTANNDDSTFAISDKVYDRAMVINLDKKAEVFEGERVDNLSLSIDHLQELFTNAQNEYAITDRNLRRIKELDKYLTETFHITFGNRIMKQIRAYVPVVVASGGDELEAIDDILARKVLRKLESKNPVSVRAQAEGLCTFIEDLFGVNKLPLCIETIHHIEQNV